MSGATTSPTLESACALAEHGIAVHWLKSKSKAPRFDDWSKLPVNAPSDLVATWQDGYNLGIRLGEWSKVGGIFLHAIDLDIRDPSKAEEAHAYLHEMAPGLNLLPFVISGSGGASRHFYFPTDRPFRSRKLAHSAEKFTGKDGKQHWAWEIELFGTGKQVACPPSIHPDTGKEYVWGRPIDFDLIDLAAIPAETVQGWGVGSGEITDEEDDLAAEVHRSPLGLKDEEIQRHLDGLDHDQYCEDREGWLIVGMALHHELEGAERGLEFWKTFSAKSKKYDPKDIRRVWDSFRGNLRPVRFPTLIKAAGIARLERDHEESDALAFDEAVADPEIAALLGDASTSDDDIDAIGTAPSSVDKEWRRLLDLNEEGLIKPTLTNLALILANDPRTAPLMHYNAFVQEIMQRHKPGFLKRKGAKPTIQLDGPVWELRDAVNGDLWTDSKDAAMRHMIEAPRTQGGYGIKVTERDMQDAINVVAHKRPYHPVREYLESLKWDGKERVETLFIDYLGTPDNAYYRQAALLAMIAAVTRANEPAHKFDFVPILKGGQGVGKSTFIKILGKSWFTELHGDFSDRKKMIEKMQGAWICELPELSSFGKTEVEEIKAFISATEDKDRLAYDARAQPFLRQSVPWGSTNNELFLKDETGNRRFWPLTVTVKSINTAKLAREIDQLWAEVVVIYRRMRAEQPHGTLPLFLKGEAVKIAVKLQESHRVESPEEIMAGRLAAFLEEDKTDPSGFDDVDDLLGSPVKRDEVSLAELWVECLGRDFAQMAIDRRTVTMLGMAMQRVKGWIKAGQLRTKQFGRQRVYKRVA